MTRVSSHFRHRAAYLWNLQTDPQASEGTVQAPRRQTAGHLHSSENELGRGCRRGDLRPVRVAVRPLQWAVLLLWQLVATHPRHLSRLQVGGVALVHGQEGSKRLG